MKPAQRVFILSILFFLQTTVVGASAGSVEVVARIDGKVSRSFAPNILYSFGNKTADIFLSVTNHCSDAFGLKVEFRQLAGRIAAPLGVVHERAYDPESKPEGMKEVSFSLTIPAVQRETDFELVYFVQKEKKGSWEIADSMTLKVYPDTLLEKMHSYAKDSTFIILDASGALQKLMKDQKVPFIDLPGEYSRVEKIDPETRVVALCSTEPVKDDKTWDELEEYVAIVEEFTDAVIVFKKRSSELSQLYVKEKDEVFHVVAEIDLLEDLPENPKSQQNLLQVIDTVFEHMNSEKK